MRSTSSNRTLWALVDCNNFFASCERLFRPDLANRPVIVLSSNDGCVVARSNEAKALGIGMGEPEFKVRPLLRRHKVAVFSSNFALYGDISARVMRTMESLVPHVEQYSIDEAFIPLTGPLAANADELAGTLRKRVAGWTGIVTSIGLGTTRTLAKLASDAAKKSGGVLRLEAGTAGTDAMLAQTPVGEVWGIGRRSVEKLRLRGILTAKNLRDADDGKTRKLLSIAGLHTALELRGISCVSRTEIPASRRTMVSSRSFGQRVTDKEHLAEALAMHAASVGERLRREKLLCGAITVHIRTSRYGQGPFYDEITQIGLPLPTASTKDLIRATREGLENIFRPGFSYAKAGLMLFDLISRNALQGSLAEADASGADAKRRDRELMRVLDAANRKFGRGALRFAAEGGADAPWQASSSKRSPRWTTVWEDLPLVR
ncbi:MAG: Y-family DNA polymerase [Desulfovibrio sp.]|jgi:DNA polymerase V|nr:Y-family DNA polymerase [Desulfovibrio sp.]